MNSIWLTAASLVIFILGYRFYSKFLAERIYQLNSKVTGNSILTLLIGALQSSR